MARIRSLKPEFFRDQKVLAVSFGARLLFQGLWTAADREGRLRDQPGQFKLDYFPTDRVNIEQLLSELTDPGHLLIVRYHVDGERYIAIPNFLRHQRPHMNEPRSVIPPPPPTTENTEAREMSRAAPSPPDMSRAAPSPPEHSAGKEGDLERKGREGQGKGCGEGEGEGPSRSDGGCVSLESLPALYRRLCPSLPQWDTITPARRVKLRLRLAEHPDPAWWEAVFRRVAATPFLRGENPRSWRATLDWLIANDHHALQVHEGKYGAAEKRPAPFRAPGRPSPPPVVASVGKPVPPAVGPADIAAQRAKLREQAAEISARERRERG